MFVAGRCVAAVMSRRANLTKALASGYGAMAVNVVFTLGSVPVALSYLSTAEFGLWALVSQLATYLLPCHPCDRPRSAR